LIARSLEHPRQVELAGAGPQGSMSEADTRPGKNTEPTRSHPVLDFLSLFKGQGAAVRGDDRVVNVRHGIPPAEGD
jgi:hypothetical protein